MPSRRSRDIDKDDAFEEAMHLLQHQGGINFREYKPATVMRRIERRMQVRHAPDLANYVRLLDNDRGELAVLRREMLIPVTSFFRDPETFDILAETVVKTIVAGRGENQPIRVWVAGASTGEEAYSLAILFAEAFDRARRWPNVKLFATDVEQQNVEVGGAGVFSEAITAELSPERLERFFYKRGNHFVVKNEIRQSIVFAKHNLLEDPPFTRMDLVSCRNLLIYFRTQAHERALRRIQYALAPGGFLFLGPSETLAELQSDFTAVSSKHKIYRILRHVSLPLDLANTPLVPRAGGVPGRRLGRRGHQLASDAAVIDAGQSMLLRGYAPASLLLSSRFELLHVFGEVGDYLRIAEGNATRESLQATIEELETANEELQATNEELMASNEELQSSNEEL
ncbi:CheR family methyltransferase, partial [Thiocapsa sp.]|uniref:CheR family methyltransferase n=1 Tax=Thiocapsa sp. TaxID=2024551 RepID=UPI0035947A47